MQKRDLSGVLLHARHAFMPNSLGYCGPDDRGKILEHLQISSTTEDLVSILKRFEAAYPFIRFIAGSTGNAVFDKKVTEAYWIGNDLLDRVAPDAFYKFARTGLKESLSKVDPSNYRQLFARPGAIPHHSFYVMATGLHILSDVHVTSSAILDKISDTINSCMISYGRVVEVGEDHLFVRRRRAEVNEQGFVILKKERGLAKIKYDGALPNFQNIVIGDHVSIHWNFACEVLSSQQVRNIASYTRRDIVAVNHFTRSRSPKKF
jgi:Family of unknown function (DUF6390)